MISDYEPQTFDEVLMMANWEIKLDEDPARIVALKGKSSKNVDTRGPKKANGRFYPHKKHYLRPIENNFNNVSCASGQNKKKKAMPDYDLSIESNALIAILKTIGSSVT